MDAGRGSNMDEAAGIDLESRIQSQDSQLPPPPLSPSSPLHPPTPAPPSPCPSPSSASQQVSQPPEYHIITIDADIENEKALPAFQLESSDQTRGIGKSLMICLVVAMGAGTQFGFALQISLLAPYVQLLGISHKVAPFIWLCGPLFGLFAQPMIGYYSDKCTSRFGHRPFIAAGALLVAVAVVLIGFAADIGHICGDLLDQYAKTRAIAIFIIGFTILDVANNILQDTCRAFLAEILGGNAHETGVSYAGYSFSIAMGNVLGYAAGSYNKLQKLFPFTQTKACDVSCANLKSFFFIFIAFLSTLTILVLTFVPEKVFSGQESKATDEKHDNKLPLLFAALKNLPKSMWILYFL